MNPQMKRPPRPPGPRELGRAHAFLAAQNAFTSFLDVPCSLVTRTGSWIVVYNSGAPSVVEAHNALGQREARGKYNALHVGRVLATQQPLETSLHGFSDLWVPIVRDGRCDNLLVSGPFSRQPWGAAEIRHNWQTLTGEKPRAFSPAAFWMICVRRRKSAH